MWWHFPYLPWITYDGKATLIAFHRHWSLQHLHCQPSSQTCVCAGKLIWLFGTLGGWQEAGAPFKQPKYKDESQDLRPSPRTMGRGQWLLLRPLMVTVMLMPL